MVLDNNKGITGIVYNYLNLPQTITTLKGTINYTYDAAGNKLKKVTKEPASAANQNVATTTTTNYTGGFVYESKMHSPSQTTDYTDVLQFGMHEEGRLRFKPANGVIPAALLYDYFIKDHLGNTRLVLREEKQPDTYPALSFEGAAGSTEINNQNTIWEKADGTQFDVIGKRTTIAALQNASTLVPPTQTYSLLVRSSTGKIGAGKLIKVMNGDKIHTTVQYYFSQNTGGVTGNGLGTLVGGLVSALANSVATTGLIKMNATTISNSINADGNAGTFFTNQNNSSSGTSPKAYLNVLFFDEQFKFDNVNSYTEQIGATNPGQIVIAMGSAREAKKNGYCYIYISNETNDMVYFDNFTLQHEHSPVLEETHYYPFGLTMAGISSKAAGKVDNKKKYNGYELNTDFDINIGEAFFRTHDAQLGRWWQIDPKAIDELSPYASMSNNPILNMDVLGDTTTYYDNHGNTLYTTYAKGYNNAFIVGDDYLDAAKGMFGKLGKLDLDQQKALDGAIVGLNNVMDFGDAYDLQSITQFYDENVSKNSISKIDGISIDKMDNVKLDGKNISKSYVKNLKGAEATFDMVKKSGVWTVDKNSIKTENSFNSSDQGSFSNPNGHLHPNVKQFNGRELSYTYSGVETRIGRVNGSGITSQTDMDRAKTQGKVNGTIRNVVVTSNAIYLYNGTINQQIRKN